MYIKWGKTIDYFLENLSIEDFITNFVTNMLFWHVGLSPIIIKNSFFILRTTLLLGYLMDHSIILQYFHFRMVPNLKIMLQLLHETDIIKFVQLRLITDTNQL